MLLADQFFVDQFLRRIVARIAVVAGAAKTGQMRPVEEDVSDVLGPQCRQALFSRTSTKEPRELAVVEAGVVHRGYFQLEWLGVADEQRAFAWLRIRVQPAMRGVQPLAPVNELQVIAPHRCK